jgi:hypothetical protein
VAHWRCEPIRRGIGAATGGVYRLAGIGHDRGTLVPWSLVLKVVRPPAGHAVGGVGVAPAGWGEAPADAHYWKREALAYQTGLQAKLPRGLAAPRCLGIGEPSARHGRAIWLWLEEVVEAGERAWPLTRYGLAARHLGRFNGAHVDRVPPESWWSRGRWGPRGAWAPHFQQMAAAVERDDVWAHPTVRRAYPAGTRERLRRVWAAYDRLWEAGQRLPMTLCHHDAFRTNLIARVRPDGEPETVGIDWAMAGRGWLGAELGALLTASVTWAGFPAQGARELAEAVFEGYLAGLRDAGWSGDAAVPRLGFALACAPWAPLTAGLWFMTDPEAAARAQRMWRRPLEELVAIRAVMTPLLLDLVDEAYARVDASA